MTCTIKWTSCTRAQWDDLMARCDHVTLLQSYYYAQAMRDVHYQGVRHGIIMIDGAEAGIVQMQEVSLFRRLIHAIAIDRGPLWFHGYGSSAHLQAFGEALDTQFPKRFTRKRRFLPEFFQKNDDILLKNWSKIKKISNYKTFFVDISTDLEEIRKNLRKKWRNILNKSEKNRFSVENDENLTTFLDLMRRYMADRLQKGYAGASPKFLSALARYACADRSCLLLNAVEDDEIIASVLIFIHGSGATYQVGVTTPYGRDQGAHYRLLWEAIKILKARGVTSFDLGGYNDETEGIKKFKEGLGGHPVALIGRYE